MSGSAESAGDARRLEQSTEIRRHAARGNERAGIPPHPANGDEHRYHHKVASYTKGLPHDELGEVDLAAYASLARALRSGDPDDFEAIVLGSDPAHRRRLVDPQAGLAFDLEGGDAHQFAIAPAPEFDSPAEAAEIVENYWMALLRDTRFDAYATDPVAAAAAAELQGLDYQGPRGPGGTVTPEVLFRGELPGDPSGPYVSQFMLLPPTFGAQTVDPRLATYVPGSDYLTAYDDWLDVQNGTTRGPNAFDAQTRYARNGRDMAAFVHVDVLYQAYFNACLVLLDVDAPLNPGNPYVTSATQEGFGTFGPPHVKTILAEVATRALKAVWYQKWFVHRRLRPEAFGGALHNVKTGAAGYPVHADALGAHAVERVHAAHGTYLLPMAFPEGSPLHPAYGQGHATVAAACVTVLKAFFDGSAKLADLLRAKPLIEPATGAALGAPVVAAPDGRTVQPYGGADAADLTVEGELNKIASNIALARCHAGVHWRSDYRASMRLGEDVALRILRDQRPCYNERFDGFTFNRFFPVDGTLQVTV